MVNLINVDLMRLASNIPYANHLHSIATASTDQVTFLSYHDSFQTDVLGPNPSSELAFEAGWDAFHEAGVYNIKTGLLYATSNFVIEEGTDNPINVTAIDINGNNNITSIRYPKVSEANGGCAYYPVGT